MSNREFTNEDFEGVQEIRRINTEFLNGKKCSSLVRKYLEEASANEELLIRFLRGRKYRPKHAWETLKRYAEVRFDEFPEVFPQTFPTELEALKENPSLGVLKSRDSLGRRIMFFSSANWDPDKCSLEALTIASVVLAEKMLLDEDGLNNGFVYIQDCSGVGIKQAKEYTLRAMRRLVNIFWFAFPLKLKSIYFINVPTILSVVFAMAGPFLTKKLKERLHIIGVGKDYQDIYQNISLDKLPKCFGGTLEINDAVDTSFFDF